MVAIVFPGQGSQKPGMGQSLVQEYSEAAAVFDRVSAALSQDVRKLLWETDEDTLRKTENAQVGLYTVGLAAWEVLKARVPEGTVEAAAGHSVGEYAAIAAAGVVSLEDGARLVAERGRLMSEVTGGSMAAVLGLDREALDAACAEAGGTVVVANDNSPGQLVISGESAAVAKAGELASAKGAKRVIPLNVSGAFHSPLMQGPAFEMRKALQTASFGYGNLKVYANVTAEPVTDAAEWKGLLELQLQRPVRWTETIQNMRRDGAHIFIECGAGEVLSGLLRRIDKEAKGLRVGDPESLEETRLALSAG
jgi:[acyl-carrier-protein] S-malonyltransferase